MSTTRGSENVLFRDVGERVVLVLSMMSHRFTSVLRPNGDMNLPYFFPIDNFEVSLPSVNRPVVVFDGKNRSQMRSFIAQ